MMILRGANANAAASQPRHPLTASTLLPQRIPIQSRHRHRRPQALSIGSSSGELLQAALQPSATVPAPPPSSFLASAVDAAQHAAAPFAFAAAVVAVTALVAEAVPLITLVSRRRMTSRAALRFGVGPADAPGRVRFVGATALSLVPHLSWASWLLIASLDEDGPRRRFAHAFALLYLLPLAEYTDAFSRPFAPAAAAMWALCVVHVQVHRLLCTNKLV